MPGLVRRVSAGEWSEGMASEIVGAAVKELGETKIEDFDGAGFGDKNICGLEVAVDDTLFVGGIEGIGKLHAHFDGAVDGQCAGGQNFVERIPDKELHGDEGAAVMFFDSVDGANSGMVESGSGARFAQEAFECRRVALIFFRNELEGHAAAELGVLGFVDHAHAAGAELTQNPVMGDGLVNHEQGCKRDVRRSENTGQCVPGARHCVGFRFCGIPKLIPLLPGKCAGSQLDGSAQDGDFMDTFGLSGRPAIIKLPPQPSQKMRLHLPPCHIPQTMSPAW